MIRFPIRSRQRTVPVLDNTTSIHSSHPSTIGMRIAVADRSVAKPKSKFELLPAELLCIIFNFLLDGSFDGSNVNLARLICRTFRDNAWEAFGSSFNRRVFHPTYRSIKCLYQLAQIEELSKYVTCLNLSTVTYSCIAGTYYNWAALDWQKVQKQAHEPAHKQFNSQFNVQAVGNMLKEYELLLKEEVTLFELAGCLRRSLAMLNRLSTIKLINFEKKEQRAIFPGLSTTTKNMLDTAYLQTYLFNQNDHRWTLGLLFEAYTPGHSVILPKLSEIDGMDALIPVSSLPLCFCLSSSLFSTSCTAPRFQYLTILTLKIDTKVGGQEEPRTDENARRLPFLLSSAPNLESLDLEFPRLDLSSWILLSSAFYGNFGFQPISILHFPRLRSLRLGNLALPFADPLMALLYSHRSTLRNLHLSHVALGMGSWKRLLEVIVETLQLDEMVWGSFKPGSDEERKRRDELRRIMPVHLQPSRDLIVAAAQRTWIVDAETRESLYCVERDDRINAME